MKKKSILFVTVLTALFFTTISNAQYSIEANYGLSGVFEPSSNELKHFGAGVSYDFNEVYGIKLDFGSDKFRVDNTVSGTSGINVTRISLQGTLNISTAISRINSDKTFNLIAHAGGGISTIKPFNTTGGNDNAMNVVLGLTPRFKISRGLYFAVDTALVFNISQHYNFDGSLAYENTPNSFTGITYNVTGGIVYQIRNY
jgi:OOP family OmpA-OmpF porin